MPCARKCDCVQIDCRDYSTQSVLGMNIITKDKLNQYFAGNALYLPNRLI